MTASTEVVEAREFRLVDSEGRVRAVLGVEPRTDRVVLQLCDSSTRTRLAALVDRDGAPVLCLFDEQQKPALRLSRSHSLTGLVVCSANGCVRFIAGVNNHGEAVVDARDQYGRIRAAIGTDAWGRPALAMRDGIGRVRGYSFPELPRHRWD